MDPISLSLAIWIILIAIPSIVAMNRRRKVRQQVENNAIAWIKGAKLRYPDLLLENYGVLLKVEDTNRVEVIFPFLTPKGSVEYIHSWHELTDVQISGRKLTQSEKFEVACEVVSVIKEYLNVGSEVAALEEQSEQINRLVGLISTSDLYASQLSIYKRALAQVQELLERAEELRQLYTQIIREALIGIQLAEYNPRIIQDHRLMYRERHQQLKAEYQSVKDMVKTYSRLAP